eukprot:TRINITY_DN4720_c0_g1_i3.p1 TRINITY_DN4720_c0_g1~~TRINITY_DN4720_c0_g1_i3.p1  ORF type:complete len:248 (+),score=43.00 TRINITY_DN4720_c0_g1_i3:449-1192(+)
MKSERLAGDMAELKGSVESSLKQRCTSRQNAHSHTPIKRPFALRLKKLKKRLVADNAEVKSQLTIVGGNILSKNEYSADRTKNKAPLKLRFNPLIPHKAHNGRPQDVFTLFSNRKRLNLQALEHEFSCPHESPSRVREALGSSVARDDLGERTASVKAGRGEVRGRNSNLGCKGSLQTFRITGKVKRERTERSGRADTEGDEESALNISAVMKEVNVRREDSVLLFPAFQCNYKDTRMAIADVIYQA